MRLAADAIEHAPGAAARVARRIHVSGIVQGVGYRPFVWRLARELELAGWVRNDAAGVEIAAEGARSRVEALLEHLRAEAPPRARVERVRCAHAPALGLGAFSIVASARGSALTTIGADVAVCRDCLEEMFDPGARRWRHAFITCTQCGPRYTVTRSLPFDRAGTSLEPFPLCRACAREYAAPADRRFHAETLCCAACGPTLALRGLGGRPLPGDPIAATLARLRAGDIVAIKGLGGFHLACDARNVEALARLRAAKEREAKPFAVMAANAASLEGLARIDPDALDRLQSPERPIVLLRARTADVLPGVAPGLDEIGAMLPTTPIHYLLLHEAAGRPAGCAWLEQAQDLLLVMTSANAGGEPILRSGNEIRERLAGVADAVLDHDRDVVARCDDSVVRCSEDGVQTLRRSRGHCAYPIALRRPLPQVLALGAEMKGSICATRGEQAFLAPHIGALDNAATRRCFDENVERMLDMLGVTPRTVVHDLHPDYYSTRVAAEVAAARGASCVAVAHHHAHIAAVCAEHALSGEVLGLALDGTGLGPDGGAWGGELLQVAGAACTRLGRLRPLQLPGAERAAREPWRMAASVLHALGRGSEIQSRLAQTEAGALARMLESGWQCPPSSSMGRVFDAAAGLLGLCAHMRYEAQAAMLLEQAAVRSIERCGWPQAVIDGWYLGGDEELDLRPLLASLIGAADKEEAAARFHSTLAAALAAWVAQAAQRRKLRRIVLGGGCFLNSLLRVRLRALLEARGLQVFAPVQLPPGDAGIALGQAWIAIASLE